MVTRLDIGCGNHLKEGFIGIDPFIDHPNVIKTSMDALPFEDNSVDEIYSSHALEHIGKYHVPPTLREWYRVLKPTGHIELHVPDLKWCVLNWLMKGEPTDWNLDTIFGNQEHAGEYHRTGFTVESLRNYVAQAGFKVHQTDIIDSHSQPTIRMILIK